MKQSDFATQAHQFNGLLLAHALKFTKDVDDAQDLVQDTLIKGIRFCDKFEEGSNIKSWLYVIMRNTYINNYRKNQKKLLLITTEEEISSAHLVHTATSNSSLSSFALADIDKAMNSLKPRYRVPFQRYFEGYKYEEIATELELPLGTVKTRIHEARLQLKKLLKVYNYLRSDQL